MVEHPQAAGEWAIGLLFFVLFVSASSVVLMFEVRRQAFSVTLVEIPFLLGLFFLPPLTLILVRVLGSVVAQTHRRVPPIKLCFNTASHAAGAALACVLVFAAGPLQGASPRTWLVLSGAVGINVLVTLAGVVGVITLVQGRISSRELARTAVPGLVVAGINTTIGLLVLVVVDQGGVWSVFILAALASFFVVAYRAYAQFLRQHRTLSEIYDLTRAIADTPHDGTLPDVLLGRVRELLQAEYATLWMPVLGRYPEVLLSARVDDRGLVDVAGTPDTLRRRVMETGETVAVGAKFGDAQLREHLLESGAKDAIAVPLKAGSAVIGCLEVSGRLGDLTHFGPGDVRLLEAVAAHAAVAVENSRLVDRLRHDAAHDGLSGLPNRRRITAALEESVTVRAPGEVVAVLLFDVDGLRQVNESLGHAAGDQVLVEVARRLRASAPSSALVGRLGSDEFVVTLRAENADTAMDLAAELREQIRDQMIFGTLTLDVDTAVGVVVHPDHGSDPATLLQRADLAATAAKTMPGSVQLFNPGLESRSVRRLGLAGDLRRALDNDELEVYFQPKVTLGDRRLVGVECLARWEHPSHGAVSPEDFVAVAEHTGQLSKLTEAVLKEGLRRCRDWEVRHDALSVAVNLSARTLNDPHFPNRVEELLGEFGVPPERLTFEIKEEGVLDGTDRPMPTLRRLRDLGVRLSVDDFGTGYSSLSYLRRLPVNEVKVDRSFVQGMATDPGDLAIVNAVVTLSQQFGLTVVAEGVESELTLELLQDIGCQIGQGFLFSRPLPYERLAAWYEAQTEPESALSAEVRRLRAVP
ncbi:sensor domain-containing phosphodiesterase [Micromonospora sp. NPDC049679]|uniref:putative bifunctional diguanylate cyclase/phosphodiesterase n=1 Tax=Micromonospora sp. NPDC049679 TaxID=3155920 RepID=UPI0033CFA742